MTLDGADSATTIMLAVYNGTTHLNTSTATSSNDDPGTAAAGWLDTALDWISDPHNALDVVGWIPIVGEVADAINAGLYLYEGDYKNAALSAISLVPVVGDVIGKGAKIAVKAAKAIDAVATAGKISAGAARTADVVGGALKAGKGMAQSGLRNATDKVLDAGRSMGFRVPTTACNVPIINKLANACFVPGTLVIVAGETIDEVNGEQPPLLVDGEAATAESIEPKLLTSDLAPALALVAAGAVLVRGAGERERRKPALRAPRRPRRGRVLPREIDHLHAVLREDELAPEVEMNHEEACDLLFDQALAAWSERDAAADARETALRDLREELPPLPDASRSARCDAPPPPMTSLHAHRRRPECEPLRNASPYHSSQYHAADDLALGDDQDHRAAVAAFATNRRSKRLAVVGVALAILFCWFGLPAIRNAESPTSAAPKTAAATVTSRAELRQVSYASGPPAKRIEDIQLGDRVAGPHIDAGNKPSFETGELLPPLSAEELELLEELQLLVPDEPVWYQVPPSAAAPHGFSFLVKANVITEVKSSTSEARTQLVGQRYVVGDVDATDVSPWTWRTVSMELTKADRSRAVLRVARPWWWIEETGAKPGATLDIAMHEVGLEGQAKVLDVGMLDVDDDLGDPNACVVIATIEHHNAIVWDLRFEDQRGPPLGVTANHPIYSLERDDWVPAGELRIGETVATYDGLTKLAEKTERPGRHSVHNLEVHRSHAYHVSQFGVLAHNAGVGCGPILTKLTQRQSDAFRSVARRLWSTRTGSLASTHDLFIHHRIPLEWAHKFPLVRPNRAANLLGLPGAPHDAITNAWGVFRRSLNGRDPTASEIMKQAIEIDKSFSRFYRFLP